MADFDAFGGTSRAFDLRSDLCGGVPSVLSGPCNVRFGVVSESPELEMLDIRVLFCPSETCGDETMQPGFVLSVERPFYRGQRTFLVGDFDPVENPVQNLAMIPSVQPPAPTGARRTTISVDSCRVGGCTTGDIPTPPTYYCFESGVHFCDRQ